MTEELYLYDPRIKVRIRRDGINLGGEYLSVVLYARDKNSGIRIAEPLVMADHKDGVLTTPTFSLDNETAQQVMDQLWDCGLRPTEGTGSAGAMAATRLHLNDMQEFASKLLAKVLESRS